MKKNIGKKVSVLVMAGILTVSNTMLAPMAAEQAVPAATEAAVSYVSVPGSFTMATPKSLDSIALSGVCKGNGFFAWATPSKIPAKGIGTYEIVFTPADAASVDYSAEKGWDAAAKVVRRYVTVTCTSLKQAEEEALVTPTPEITATPEVTETPAVTETPTATETPVATETPTPEVTETPETTEVPEITETPVVTQAPEATKTPDKVETTETPVATGTPEITEKPVVTEQPAAEDPALVIIAPTQTPETVDNTGNTTEVTGTPTVTIPAQAATSAEQSVPVATDEAQQALLAQQEAIAKQNHTSNGVTVSGDLPWYVQLRVTFGNNTAGYDKPAIDTILPVEMTLWNTLTDSKYYLPAGQSVTITMAAPANLTLYDGLTVVHYLDASHYELIELHVNGDTISFATSSFSPFDIAGSTVLVGGTTSTSGGTGNKTSSTTGTTGNTTTANKSSSSGSASSSNTTASKSNSSKKTSSTGNTSSKTSVSNPKTGDDANVILYYVIGGLAVVVCIGLIVYALMKKKKEKE